MACELVFPFVARPLEKNLDLLFSKIAVPL